MNRKAKTKPVLDTDITKPIDLEKLQAFQQDGDCFGKECAPKDEACATCCSMELCVIVMGAEVKKKEKALEAEQGPYLDSVNTSNIPWDKLKPLIEKKYKAGTPLTVQEVVDWAMGKMNTKDRKLAVAAVKGFILGTEEIHTKDGEFTYGV